MQYPGRIIKIGDKDKVVVAAIIAQLNKRGYPSPAGQADFDANLKSLVSLFQAQHADVAGRPLEIDGEVGSNTWGSLFEATPVVTAPTGIAGAALGIAISQLGVMESPIGSNKGPQVNQYLKSVGLGGGFFWCMAFVHWCFDQAAAGQGIANPFPKTAGCADAWARVRSSAPKRIVTAAAALANPSIVRPGFVFILDFGKGAGHTGFVKQSLGGPFRSVEGNSNNDGSRNGVGVFELNRRKITDRSLKGFLDFTDA
jgi:hypothetical protein